MLRLRLFTFLFTILILSFQFSFAQWEVQDPGFPEDMNALFYHAVDENVVWAVGGRELDQAVYQGFSKTTDGGETWTLGNVPAGENYFFSNIFALSDSVAWVTMVDNEIIPHEGKIFKTIDGGVNWTVQFGDSTDIQGLFNWVYFWDENEGLAVADHGTAGRIEIFKTADGGNSWKIIANENIPETILTDGGEQPTHSNRSVIGDSAIWFNTNKGRVFRSTNRGQNWTVADIGLGASVAYTSFSDEMNGLATVPILSKNIAKTVDGGITWETTSNQLPINAGLLHITGTTNTYMYLTGNLGIYLGTGDHGYGVTKDEGATFEMEGDIPFNNLSFVNASTGWAGNTANNKIYKWIGPSLDNTNWKAQEPGFPEGIAAVFSYVVNDSVVWTVGGHEIEKPSYHGFSKTTDGGVTWHADTIEVDYLENFRFSSIFALNENLAWVTMIDDITPIHKGRVFKTSDGGETWENQSTAFPDDEVLGHKPAFVYFFDENNGFTVGYYGEHYVTSNGGNLWTLVSEENRPTIIDDERPFTSNFWSVGDSIAWYGTSKGRVFKTTNRGSSWTAYDVNLGEGIVFASFKDELNGLAVTPVINKNIAKTTDGGETWQTLPNQVPTNAILIYVKGTENTYMYGSGDLPSFIGSDPGSGFTADEGNSWMFENDMPLEPMFSTNSANGWANGNTFENKIYKWIGPNLDSPTAIDKAVLFNNPENFTLSQNYPNPFNPTTTISYSLLHNSNVNLTIYNMLGQKVRTLINQNQSSGIKKVVWNGRDNAGNQVASGIYFYRLEAVGFEETKRMLLIR